MAEAAAKNVQGKFVWYDVMTTDMKAAEAFYSNVLGWTIADSGMPGRQYALASAGTTMIGGIMPIPDDSAKAGVPPMWMGYIAVPDVDAMAVRVKQAGGSIHRGPEDIPNVGRFAVAGDPHGAGFIIFKPNSDQQPAPVAPGTPGHVGWRELQAGNGPEAYAFYSGLFGWTKGAAIEMGPHGVYQLFAIDGIDVGGIMTKDANVPMPHWFYTFNVDAIDAAAERVRKAGGKIVVDVHQVPGGQWLVRCTDPAGAAFGLVAMKR